jgi:Tail-tube assembly protein
VGNAQRFPHTVEFQAWLPTQTTIGDIGVVQATQTKLNDIAGGAYNKVSGGVESVTKWIADKSNAAIGAVGGSTDFFGARTLGKVGESYVDPYDSDMMKVDRNKAYSDRLFDFKRRATRSDVITMYMPQGTYNDRINNAYNQKSMTEAIGLTGGVLEVMSAISKENITTGDMLNGPAGMEVIGQMAGGLGMDAGTITDAGLAAIGYALNPQFEMLYNGTDLREFQFDFTMTPRSVDEAVMINDIINKFKYHGSPQFLTGQGRYIVPPSYFDITFNFNGSRNEWLPQISTCVLKSVDIDYTGGLEQWASFSDGSPVQVKMVLVFVELEMMHKKLREEGY